MLTVSPVTALLQWWHVTPRPEEGEPG